MSKRVLIVDDHSSVADMMGQMLRVLGHDAKVFSSPAACLEWLQYDAPDIAFLDLRMPGIDGVELLEQIRADGHTFPVVAITGYATEEMVREATDLGAVAVACKPVTMDVLQGLVQLS
jgi:DNA-binding NtrC family response regulator